MNAPLYASNSSDPLPPEQADAIWGVLEAIEQDGGGDMRGWVSPTRFGTAIIDHWADDRRWIVQPNGHVTWGPIPMAAYRAAGK